MLIAVQYSNLRFYGFGDFILQNQNLIYLKSNNLWNLFPEKVVLVCISWLDQFNLAGAGVAASERENKYLQFITVK